MLLVLPGCQADPAEQDREHYQAVLSDPRPAAEALAQCHLIIDPTLAGDCALVVVAADESPWGLCEEVPEGMWREECWFISAEALNRRGDALGAAQLCGRSGRFTQDCAQHLWQTPVHGLIHGPGARAFAAQLPRAEALYAAWAPLLAGQTDFAERFWAKFFGNGFEGQGLPIDLGWCEPVPEAHRAACVAAGVAHYAREIGPGVEQAGGLEEMCALESPDVAALSGWLAAVPDPRLNAAAAARVVEICTTHPHRQRR
jgi:hypothetical protein